MIVCCGEALVDLVPDPVPGGGPMNTAIAAARLGAPSAFVGRISTDDHGEAIWRHLQDNHVDLRACERGPEPTAQAIVEHEPDLSFRFEGENPAHENLGMVDLDVLGQASPVVHGGALALFRGRTAETLADLVERHQGIVSIDPNVRPQVVDDRERWDSFHRRWMARAHLYRASDEDADWIWPGRPADSWAGELLEGTARAVLVTHGGDGATVFTEAGRVDVPGRQVAVVDTVGAGDAFVASMLTSVLELGASDRPAALAALTLDDWEAVAERAVEVSALACTRRGANPPFHSELE